MGLPKTRAKTTMQQEQIIENLPLVHHEVKRLIRKGMVHQEYDELVQMGTIGLMEAIYRFDELVGQSFSKYARIRIRGAILDELRKRDWIPRSVRQRSKNLSNGIALLEEKLKRTPTQKEICSYLGIEESKYSSYCFHANIAPLVSMDEGEYPIRNTISSHESNPQETLLHKEEIETLQHVMQTLSEQEKEIIHQYYYEGLRMKDIAVNFDVSESRICQIHRNIKAKLAQKIRIHAKTSKKSHS